MKARQGIWILGLLIILAGAFVASQRCLDNTPKLAFRDTPPPWPTDTPILHATETARQIYWGRLVQMGKTSPSMGTGYWTRVEAPTEGHWVFTDQLNVTCHWARVIAWRERCDVSYSKDDVKPRSATIVREVLIGCQVSTTNASPMILVSYSQSENGTNWTLPYLGDYIVGSASNLPSRRIIERSLLSWRVYQGKQTRSCLMTGTEIRSHIRNGAFIGFGDINAGMGQGYPERHAEKE